MPTNLISEQEQARLEAIAEYYKTTMYIVKMLRYWPKESDEIQEFLDYGVRSEQIPEELEEFLEAIASVYYAGMRAGIREYLGERQLRALARNLYRSESRQESYRKTLHARYANVVGLIKGGKYAPEKVTAISLRELEERYQYHLWLNRQENCRGTSIDFFKWREQGYCHTFYDIISGSCELSF